MKKVIASIVCNYCHRGGRKGDAPLRKAVGGQFYVCERCMRLGKFRKPNVKTQMEPKR